MKSDGTHFALFSFIGVLFLRGVQQGEVFEEIHNEAMNRATNYQIKILEKLWGASAPCGDQNLVLKVLKVAGWHR